MGTKKNYDIKEADELEAYLNSYDAALIRELRDTENKLRTYIEEAKKQIWFIEGIKQLATQNTHSSDECPRCPFFQKWLKDAFQSRFNVELYEVPEELENEG